jgi:hypothetical protein
VTQEFNGVGQAAGAAQVVATLTPPSGDAWLFSEMVLSHDVATGSRSEHWAVFTFVDASTYQTPAFDGSWSERISFQRLAQAMPLVLPITRIDLWARAADDASPTNAVVAVWVVQLDAYP